MTKMPEQMTAAIWEYLRPNIASGVDKVATSLEYGRPIAALVFDWGCAIVWSVLLIGTLPLWAPLWLIGYAYRRSE